MAELVRAQAGTDFAAIADGFAALGRISAELADAVDEERVGGTGTDDVRDTG
jgi:hypothetical protein